MPLYVVETISMFKIKYVVECKSKEHAMDTVSMEEAKEFSQLHINENIIGAREITLEEYDRMNSELDTGYGDGTEYHPESGSPWLGRELITAVKYE